MPARIATVTILVLLAGASGALAFSRSPEPMTPVQAGEAGNDFAWDLYRQLAGKPGNLFFSPSSIDLALVMTWTGARGATAEDMGRVLHLDRHAGDDPESVAAAYGDLQKTIIGTDPPYTLRIANRLWGQKGYGFLDSFLDPLERHFGAGLQELDFTRDAEGARRTINAWVEDQTENKIQDLLQPGILDRSTRLVLTNAIYFLGNWQNMFTGNDTEDRTFHLDLDQDIRVPTMHQTHSFAYGEDELAQIIALPYENGDLEMIIALPHDTAGLAELEKHMDSDLLAGWTENLEPRKVRLYLPKFSLEGEFSLKEVLGQMGMGRAFSGAADFSGMAGTPDLAISDVIHKSFIDVFEKGTEAAAATAVAIRLTSMPRQDPDTVSFVANHPFLFLIRQTETGNILFLGRVVDPRG